MGKRPKHEPPKSSEPSSRLDGAGSILGASPRIEEALASAKRIAASAYDVLLTGESGTGKELFAVRIHAWSARRSEPFVAVNCAAIPRELFDSEMFGHGRGAFTGASEARAGLLEVADGGTLFLDEVGELDLSHQGKLLRALQIRRLRRVGAVEERPFDVRVIAATRRRLPDPASFRDDLYYRLSKTELELPPLRERREDIPLLVDHILTKEQHNLGGRRALAPEAVTLLMRFDWPGNIRQLENFLIGAAIQTDGPIISVGCVRERLRRCSPPAPHPLRSARSRALEAVEAILEGNGHVSATLLQSVLGTSRTQTSRLLIEVADTLGLAAVGRGRATRYERKDEKE